ncbi:hypothetical protein CRG98_045004 [Punica granatum]|uniref:Uncharacterized protein n=1 Tax=Punica granatum TaxID=22663 RepID=A0A2I0HSZ3_PUNGR|nr:hypothetical protein CRG98_045004 [Punica granatum]
MNLRSIACLVERALVDSNPWVQLLKSKPWHPATFEQLWKGSANWKAFIGNGARVNFRKNDVWLGDCPLRKRILGPLPRIEEQRTVLTVISTARTWELGTIILFPPPSSPPTIAKIDQVTLLHPSKLHWVPD